MDHGRPIRLRPDLPTSRHPLASRGTRAGRPGHQRLDDAALPGTRRFRDLDRRGSPGGRHARRPRTGGGGAPQLVSRLLFALGWAVAGAVVGVGLNYLSRWLARIEPIE